MRRTISGLMFLVLCSAATASAADTQSATLTVTRQTEVPGGELKPGVYTIGVIDSLQDRVVLHIDGRSGKTHLLFLGVAKPAASAGAGSQAVQWTSDASHKHFLRGYNFGSQYIEFVYPKQEAVAIAKANNSGVVAVDPQSESRPELQKLTSQDRQMITLWMLTPTEVGPSQGIEAKHYAATNSTQLARSGTSTSNPAQPTNVAPVADRSSAPVQTAELHAPAKIRPYRPALKRLPQTASQMPLLWAAGIASLLGAAGLRLRRLTA